jgi:hypothetical protein
MTRLRTRFGHDQPYEVIRDLSSVNVTGSADSSDINCKTCSRILCLNLPGVGSARFNHLTNVESVTTEDPGSPRQTIGPRTSHAAPGLARGLRGSASA